MFQVAFDHNSAATTMHAAATNMSVHAIFTVAWTPALKPNATVPGNIVNQHANENITIPMSPLGSEVCCFRKTSVVTDTSRVTAACVILSAVSDTMVSKDVLYLSRCLQDMY